MKNVFLAILLFTVCAYGSENPLSLKIYTQEAVEYYLNKSNPISVNFNDTNLQSKKDIHYYNRDTKTAIVTTYNLYAPTIESLSIQKPGQIKTLMLHDNIARITKINAHNNETLFFAELEIHEGPQKHKSYVAISAPECGESTIFCYPAAPAALLAHPNDPKVLLLSECKTAILSFGQTKSTEWFNTASTNAAEIKYIISNNTGTNFVVTTEKSSYLLSSSKTPDSTDLLSNSVHANIIALLENSLFNGINPKGDTLFAIKKEVNGYSLQTYKLNKEDLPTIKLVSISNLSSIINAHFADDFHVLIYNKQGVECYNIEDDICYTQSVQNNEKIITVTNGTDMLVRTQDNSFYVKSVITEQTKALARCLLNTNHCNWKPVVEATQNKKPINEVIKLITNASEKTTKMSSKETLTLPSSFFRNHPYITTISAFGVIALVGVLLKLGIKIIFSTATI